MSGATPGPRSCGCPETDGKIYHQRGTCTDPVVAELDWYADSDRIAAAPGSGATPGQAAPVEPWRAAWDAWRTAGGFGPAPDTGDDEVDDRWRKAWTAAAQAGHDALAAQEQDGSRTAGDAHDKLADAIHDAMSEARDCRQRGDCENCTARYSAALEAAENYARAAVAAQEPHTPELAALAAERDRFWNVLFYIAHRAPEYVSHAGPECVQAARDAIDGTAAPAVKPMPRVDWARVSEAVADRERERDEARADRDRLHNALFIIGKMIPAVGSASADECRKISEVVWAVVHDRDGQPRPAPEPTRAAPCDCCHLWSESVRALLADVTKSADATRPSRKGQIEDELAIALRKLLEDE